MAKLGFLCQNGAMSQPASQNSLLETALKRDRYLTIAGLAVIVLLAWAYLFYLAQEMDGMGEMTGMRDGAMAGSARMMEWGPVDFGLMFLMWAVMMVGMMVPSAAPMILTFAAINRRRRESGSLFVPTGVFLAGYLMVWAFFSVAATAVQWALHSATLLSPMLSSASPILGGILLLTEGVFQWTPLKNACLRHCRTPMGFITNDWREGRRGALAMGLHHGAYCLGCCWALMGLLFLLGVMNLLWIAALAGFVLAEKVVPGGLWAGRIAGLGLLVWGLWLLLNAFWG